MANLDQSGPAMSAVKGTVKWFNSTKGYGFITLESGSDAFCHASALATLGTPSLAQGSTIVCDLQESPRGLQVVTVHSVDTSTAEQSGGGGGGDRFGGGGGDRFGGGHDRFGGGDRFESGDRFGGGHDRFSSNYGGGQRRMRPSHDANSNGPGGAMIEGRVKFFNDQKGFGFVMPEDGSGDVYVHASALRRSGIPALGPEQRIRFSTRQGMKGVEVDKLELL